MLLLQVKFVKDLGHRAWNGKSLLFLLLAASLLGTYGCASASKTAKPVIPTVMLTGTSKAPVIGYYVVNDKRVDIRGPLPMTLSQPGLSQVAVRKFESEEVLTLTATTSQGSATHTIAANVDEGLRVTLDDLKISIIAPQETLVPIDTDTLTIQPYWFEETWVFDDPAHGLEHEPFVKGVPELIHELVKDIPDAQSGFRLTFSSKKFPGYQKKLVWVRAQEGGNFYRFDDKSRKGWYFPAMFRYFQEAPKTIYIRAQSKRS